MATSTTSYGSITIVDITDIGEFSVYPMSNLPLSVIYSPDQSSFTPNWQSTNLTLTPVVYYAGTKLNLSTTTGLTVTWQRQEGTAGASALTTGETVTNGVLKVTKNKFTANSTMLTYIVTASYLEPTSNTTLTAQGQITFTLVKQASSVKSCSITGDTVFKYNTSQTLVGSDKISLTATLNNVEISSWQYQKSDGTFATYPNSTTDTTLVVDASHAVFNNDKAVIKLVTNDANVYDLHTIVKLYDGAVGAGTVAAVLTNEDQMIPCNSSGTPTSYDGAETQLLIYRGGKVETSSWTITTSSKNVTYQVSTDGETWVASTSSGNFSYVKITGITADTGSVTFKAEKTGETDLIKTFSLIKMKVGANGTTPVIYTLECSALAVNKDISDVYSPSTVTVKAYSQTGTNARAAYAGRFKIAYGTSTYTSGSNESSHTISGENLADSLSKGYITVELYKAGGTTTLYDTQTIVITKDGETGGQGPQGNPGVDAINVVLGNQADVIPCTSANKTSAALTVTIPFTGYKGTAMAACTIDGTVPTLLGVTGTVTNGTASASGKIVYSIPSGTSVADVSGTMSLKFKCEGKVSVCEYRWTRSTAATNGTNAIFLMLSSPQGNIFSNGTGSLPINATLYNGNTAQTSSVTYKWYKYVNGTYSQISGQTASSLTVNGSDVDGYASFRCDATYSSKTYTQYYSMIDKTDPLQVSVHSSVGTQIINKQGAGAIYVKVTRNGKEVDALKSETFSTTPPQNPTSGDFYYKIDTENKEVTLMKYSGSAWAAATGSDLPTGTYAWTYRDKSGNVITPSGMATSGKVIYIDGSLFEDKIVADVEVTI